MTDSELPNLDTVLDDPSETLRDAADAFLNLPEPALAFSLSSDLIVGFNLAAAEFHGYGQEETLNLHLYILIDKAETDRLARAIEAVKQYGRWSGELRMKAADQTMRLMSVQVRRVGSTATMSYREIESTSQQVGLLDHIRWSSVRELSLALLDQTFPPLPLHLAAIASLVHDAGPALEAQIYHGGGRTVLLTGFPAVLLHVLKAFLQRCHYHILTIEPPLAAAAELLNGPYKVRTCLLGDAADAQAIRELHAVKPLLPMLVLGRALPNSHFVPVPIEPLLILKMLSEAIARDHHIESLAELPLPV